MDGQNVAIDPVEAYLKKIVTTPGSKCVKFVYACFCTSAVLYSECSHLSFSLIFQHAAAPSRENTDLL